MHVTLLDLRPVENLVVTASVNTEDELYRIVIAEKLHPPFASRLIKRRQFLAAATALAALGVPGLRRLRGAGASRGKLPLEQAFGREMKQFMTERRIPGGALAVLKGRRLVFVQGYGWADREQKLPVKADSLFRIASISKPFTALAILKLVETGKLDINGPAFAMAGFKPKSSGGKSLDSRLDAVTVRHCLHHTAGWDRDVSGDPMFRSVEIAQAMSAPAPAMPETIIRYMLHQPLDFEPGSRFAYSNFGYCLLGRIIEKVSGLAYSAFVHRTVLVPMGILKMRLGASLERDRAEREVNYYTPDNRRGSCVFPNLPDAVPEPYGTFCLEAMDAHGGWLASAVDLARFAAAFETREPSCLQPQTLSILNEPPAAPVGRSPDGSLAAVYYACGWNVRPKSNRKANYWHNGSLPGTFTLLVRRYDSLSWVALFNQRSENPRLPDSAIDIALHRAADSVAEWPDTDLFNSL